MSFQRKLADAKLRGRLDRIRGINDPPRETWLPMDTEALEAAWRIGWKAKDRELRTQGEGTPILRRCDVENPGRRRRH